MEKKSKYIPQINIELQSIEDLMKLERRTQEGMSVSDRIANSITGFSGSMVYVGLHVVWFGVWLALNYGIIPSIKPFDPFPFSLLTMIVSLEAIFLSSFVLISQNKQSLRADTRAKIDLEINMLAEKENTKLLLMVAEIQQHLGIREKDDPETKELEERVDVNKLAQELENAEKMLSP